MAHSSPPMKIDDKILEAAFAAFCQKAGFRKTIQRRIVYGLFYGGRRHLSVEDIMSIISKKSPGLREESIYRILGDFEREGYIRKVDVPGVKKYVYASERHGHFLCSKCGKIMDVDVSSISIPESLSGVSDISVTFNGVCPSCAQKKRKA